MKHLRTALLTTIAALAFNSAAANASTAISTLGSATATNSFDNATFGQTWTWNTLAGSDALSLTSSSTAAASNAQTLLNLGLSGANGTSGQTTYDAYFTNTHTGTNSTNVGLYASASGGTNNYAALFPSGYVGIGTNAPATGVGLDVQERVNRFGPKSYPANYSPTCTACTYMVLDMDATGNDASVVFRDTGNARGEIGLDGDDNLHFKTVSGTYDTESFSDRMIILGEGSANPGNVGIGTTNPTSLFSVGTNSAFQVDYGGGVLTAGNVTVDGTVSIGTTSNPASFTVQGAAALGSTPSLASGNTYLDVNGGNNRTETHFRTTGNNVLLSYWTNGTTPQTWAIGSGTGVTATGEFIIRDDTSGNQVMRFNTSAQILLPELANTSENNILCYGSGSYVVSYASSVAGCVPSDIDMKNPLGFIGDASGIYDLRPAIYTFKDTDRFGSDEHIGLYAQDVCNLDDRLCVQDANGEFNYDKVGMLAYTIAALQEQHRDNEALRAQLENDEATIAAMKAKLGM